MVQSLYKHIDRRTFLLLPILPVIAPFCCKTLRHTIRWKYIIIHHSAGSYGNVAFLDQVHRQRQPKDPIDSMPYHFVIGNGSGLEKGEISTGQRWQEGIWGAHVSGRNFDINLKGIGICVIGNFEIHQLPDFQYQALVKLIRSLKQEYDIEHKNIMGHRFVKGEQTLCPGKYFPIKQLLKDV